MYDCDTVVIGSGLGGLAAGLALARAGERVHVLERHALPGGWAHTFTLGGHRFSPGIHYLGELGPGQRLRRLYEGLGVARELTFCRLNPAGYDHVIVGARRVDLRAGRDELLRALGEQFPGSARGLRAYFATLERLAVEVGELAECRSPLDLWRLPLRARTLLRCGLTSLERLLRRHVDDPLLRAVLAAQCGNHGLPPSRVPAVFHAVLAMHYLDGGYYPLGGGAALPRAFISALRRHGGRLSVGAEVGEIVVERGPRGPRAMGVRLRDGRELRARRIVSNADPGVTFGRLLPSWAVPAAARRKTRRSVWSTSCLSAFIGADVDAAAVGLDSGNLWRLDSPDVEGAYRRSRTEPLAESPFPLLFLSVSSLKDRTLRPAGVHTLEAFALAPWSAFEPWRDEPSGSRSAPYEARKRALGERLLASLEALVPGLRARARFVEFATPVTNAHYCNATEGSLYGTEKTLGQLGPLGFGAASGVEGLWLCGASTLGHGVLGATVSGLRAASLMLGCAFDDLLTARDGTLRIVPADDPTAWPDDLRARACH